MRRFVGLVLAFALGMSFGPLASVGLAACTDQQQVQTVTTVYPNETVTVTSTLTISYCASAETLTPASAAALASVTVALSEVQAQLCTRQEIVTAVPLFEDRVDAKGVVTRVHVGYEYRTSIVISCEANSGVVRFDGAVVATATPAAGGLTATFTVPNVRPGAYNVTVTPRGGTPGTAVLTVLDTIAPFISGVRTPSANAAGWNSGDVIVEFACIDADSAIQSCTGPVALSTEGAGQSVTGTAVDAAGNSATATVSGINIDKTGPTLEPRASRPPDHGSWYTAPVTISFDCADALSGLALCTPPITIGAEGRAMLYSAEAFDKAGNGLAFAGTVSIDMTPPTITAPPNVVVGMSVDRCGASPAIGTAAAADNVGTVTVSNNAPTIFPKGATTVTWTATDSAGFTAGATQTVTVNDTERPAILAPAGFTVTATSASGAVVGNAAFGAATASDNCLGVGTPSVTGVPAGNLFPIGGTTLTWTVTDGSGNSSSAAQTVNVAYGVCLLYDPTRAAKVGSTIPIKLQLCAGGTNLSSASLLPHTIELVRTGSATTALVEDSGNANPDGDFRYDAGLGGTGGYIFNLSTTNLAGGAWQLRFMQGGQTYSVPFQLR